MKNIRVVIKFKNNKLHKKIYDNYDSVAHFCREADLSVMVISYYLNFKITPLAKTKQAGSISIGGFIFKKSAVKIADALNCSVLDIFPEAIQRLIGKEYIAETDSADFIQYDENMLITEQPPQDFTPVREALKALTEREQDYNI